MLQGFVVDQTHQPAHHPEIIKQAQQSTVTIAKRKITHIKKIAINNNDKVVSRSVLTLLVLLSLGMPSGMEGAEDASSRYVLSSSNSNSSPRASNSEKIRQGSMRPHTVS